MGTRTVRALVLVALSFVPLAARSAEVEARRVAEHRARWIEKPEAERSLLRARFEKLRGMPVEDRQALLARARRVMQLEREIKREASSELIEEIGELPADKREATWRRHVEAEVRRRGRTLREKLPPALLERCEAASPSERRKLLRTFVCRENGDKARLLVRRLGRMLGLEREELERLATLPADELPQTVASLRRRHFEGRVARRGLPPGLSQETWDVLATLSDTEFLEQVEVLDVPRGWLGPRHAWGEGRHGPEDRRHERGHEARERDSSEEGRRRRRDAVHDRQERRRGDEAASSGPARDDG